MSLRPRPPNLRAVVYGVLAVVAGVGGTSNLLLMRETGRIQREVTLVSTLTRQSLLVEQMARQAWHLSRPASAASARTQLRRQLVQLRDGQRATAQLLELMARDGAPVADRHLNTHLTAYAGVAQRLARPAELPAARREAEIRWLDQQASGPLGAALQSARQAVEAQSAARSRHLTTFTWYRPLIVLTLLLFLAVLVFRPLEKRIQRVQEELVRERDFAQQVMTTVAQGLSVTDAAGRFEYVNPAYAQLLGDTADNLIGRTPFDVTFEDEHEQLRAVRAQRERGRISTYETRLRRTDGQAVPVLITGSPRRSGAPWGGTIAAITDLTEHKATEQTIRTLAALSHSLELERTPAGVAERALQVLSDAVDLAWLVLYVREDQLFRPVFASSGMPPALWARLQEGLPAGQGRIWDTLGGQAVYLEASSRPDYQALGVGSVALIPLVRSTGTVTQVLCAFRQGDLQGWTDRERLLLDTAARSVAAALERAELHQDAQHSAAYAETLLAVSALTESPAPPLDIARQTLALLAPALQLSQGSVLLVQGPHVEAITAWRRSLAVEALRAQLTDRDRQVLHGVTQQVIQSGDALYVHDYPAQPGAIPALVAGGLRSAAWIPVAAVRDTHFLFVITRFHHDRAWPAQDQALIHAAARMVRVTFERQAHLQQLETVALTDALTGLGNRRAMDQALQAWTAGPHQAFGLLMIDLDGLKEVNDTLGHDWGDHLLRAFGHALRTHVRPQDQVFRPSGDEFVVVLPDAHAAQAPEILARVGQATRQVQAVTELQDCSASAGLAWSHEARSPSTLLKLADERMYQDKRRRKPGRADT